MSSFEGMQASMSTQLARKRMVFSGISTLFVLCTMLLFLLIAMPQSVFAASQTPANALPPVTNLSQIQGIQSQGNATVPYPGVKWLRIGYPSCGWGNLSGQVLQDTIRSYHQRGVRILLTVCQPPNTSPNLYDTTPLNDAAQGGADAVQCGNEEMKQDPNVAFLYFTPTQFAHWYDLCQSAMHKVQPNIPVLVGSLDPHVGGIDYWPLVAQADYLNQMQTAMNTIVHPGGTWDWHTQTLGLIDTWHNGYPTSASNSLYGLFVFWAQQFNVSLSSGALGQHIWVVEGTGCFVGCGLDPTNAAQEATSHIITLITDVLTAKQYNTPFFFFSGQDFVSGGMKWPIGVLDLNGNDKPLRQDLPMGARSLSMTCTTPSGGIKNKIVTGQEQLLATMYAGCTLPFNYIQILES